jgi:hypothetical protein
VPGFLFLERAGACGGADDPDDLFAAPRRRQWRRKSARRANLERDVDHAKMTDARDRSFPSDLLKISLGPSKRFAPFDPTI